MLHAFNTVFVALMLCGASVSANALQVRVLDEQGLAVPNAVVSLQGAESLVAAKNTYATMDQLGREFVPEVLAVQAGSWVRFPNGDDIRHHVYSFSPAKSFELKLYHGLTAEPIKFDAAGTIVLGCNIHDSMVGYIYVLDTPYYTLTDSTGVAQIAAPLGDYQLKVQHPRSTEPVQQSLVLKNTKAQLSIMLGSLAPEPRENRTKTQLEQLFE